MKGVFVIILTVMSLAAVDCLLPEPPNCGPVCLIYCEHGNIPDERGCPTCRCRPYPCPLVRCAEPCPGGFQLDKYGCQTCECRRSGCFEPRKVGPCRGAVPRYFYNKYTRQCEFFSWGGCQPNGNNFISLRQCNRTCRKGRY